MKTIRDATLPVIGEVMQALNNERQQAVLNRLARAARLALGGVPLTDPADRRTGFAFVEQGIAQIGADGLFYLTLLGRLVAYLLRAGQDGVESEAGE
jgi:hypothetical protein